MLADLMKILLASDFSYYLKAHFFHWNVEGPLFSQYHSFFSDLYNELFGAVDPIAEQIRALDCYAPGSFSRFLELTDIQDQTTIPDAQSMCRELLSDNEKVLKTLDICLKLATQFDKQGLVNFLADRIDIHNKHAWMLRSIIK